MRTRPVRWRFRGASPLAVLLSLAACSDNTVVTMADAGAPSPDAGAPSADAGVTPPSGSTGDAGTDEFTQTLMANLAAKGFQVSTGYTFLYKADDCEKFTYAASKNCYFNNPAAPYVAAVVKPWPDEYVDPSVANVMGGVVPGYTAIYRLDPREALVIYGRLPPPGKYFGYQSFVFTKEGRWKQSDYDFWAQKPNLVIPPQYLFDTVPVDDPTTTRIQSFSSMSNATNNVIIEQKSGGSFGQVRYFITTPDGSMDEALRSALAAQGVADTNVFTEPVTQRDELGSLGPIGLGKEANDFVTVMRYAVPDDPVAGDAWRSELPLTVLRVRGSAGTPKPYPLYTIDRRTAEDETADAQLTSDFATLIRSVCDRARGAPYRFQSSGCETPAPDASVLKDLVSDYGWTGPYCRSIGMNCLGDQQEAAYSFAPPLPLDDGEVYAVVGTLGTKTGNATYAAVSINNAALLKGAANLLDTALQGSAGAYAQTVRDADKLFVWYFARDCNAIAGLTDSKCTTVTPEMVPLRNDTAALGDPALKGMFQVGLRDYIKPGTARGPDGSKLIRPHILTFKPPAAQPAR